MHQVCFESLNRAWIEEYFEMEELDIQVLSDPVTHILAPGGKILMAYLGGVVAGTVALRPAGDNTWEFTKMAVAESFRGQRIGQALAEAAIEEARKLRAERIILYSNSILKPALALYQKLRFRHQPLDNTYRRSDVKMELALHYD